MKARLKSMSVHNVPRISQLYLLLMSHEARGSILLVYESRAADHSWECRWKDGRPDGPARINEAGYRDAENLYEEIRLVVLKYIHNFSFATESFYGHYPI